MNVRYLLAAALLAATATPATADLKIVTRTTFSPRAVLTQTRLVRGQRQRTQMGSGWVYIYQCDKQQLVQLNPETRLFHIIKLQPDGTQSLNLPSGPTPLSIGRYTVTTEETGRRATVFGQPAWHVRDHILNSARSIRTVVDSWYVDLPIAFGCQVSGRPPFPLDFAWPGVKVTHTGTAKRGFPVLTRRVTGEGEQQQETVVEVTELSREQFDPKLFEIPSDYQPSLDSRLRIPDTPGNRMKAAWEGFWLRAAKFIF